MIDWTTSDLHLPFSTQQKNPIALYTIGFGIVNTVSPSHTLNDRGDTLTQTDTHGGKTDLGVLLLHDIQ